MTWITGSLGHGITEALRRDEDTEFQFRGTVHPPVGGLRGQRLDTLDRDHIIR